VLFEDEHLLALAKPALLLVSPDRNDPQRPDLTKLLHDGIRRGVPWATQRGLSYLMIAHRLDFETSGVLLLAKSRSVLSKLADLFGSEKAPISYVALLQGTPSFDAMLIEAKLAPHPLQAGVMKVDEKRGKRSRTQLRIRERFDGYTLVEGQVWTHRPHQLRAHSRHIGFPIAGDSTYGGAPLLLSQLKSKYRLKPNKTERPLLSEPGLHAESLSLPHPVTGAETTIKSEVPKPLSVAIKYLRRYAASRKDAQAEG